MVWTGPLDGSSFRPNCFCRAMKKGGGPGEIEIVFGGEAGFIDHGTVEGGALHERGEFAHGGVAGGEQDALRVDGADEFGGVIGRCGAGL